MRKTLAVVVCIAGLAAGCGSSSKTAATSTTSPAATSTTTPAATGTTSTSAPTSMSSMSHGSPGTMGPPPSGTRYSAENHTFLQHLATVLGHYLESKGFHNVSVTCSAGTPTQAVCKATGTNAQGQTSTGTLTVNVDPTTGKLMFVSG